jgi:hypothetical protein
MGSRITNDNIDEFITSHIDGENKDPEIYRQVDGLLSSDDLLYKKYKSEKLTKQLLQHRLSPVTVPVSTSLKVRNSIDNLIYSASGKEAFALRGESAGAAGYAPGFVNYLKQILFTPVRLKSFPVPRYAIALVLVVVLLGAGILINNSESPAVLNPYVAGGSDKSVMVQAVNKFHKILAGDIKPQLKSNNAAEVKSFFKDKVAFDVYVPVIGDYELLGAVLDEYNGEKLAYIVYSSSDESEIIYIYETCMSSVKRRELELPDPVHAEMVNSKYYMCDEIDKNDCTMIMWLKNDVLCASVSNLPKQKMYTSFVNFK